MKWFELRIRVSCKLAVLDAGEQLSKDGKIKDKWGSKQRVLAFVEDVDSRATTAHDLRVVLVDSTLRIPNSGYVFNHNDVVGVFTLDILGILS